MMKIGLEWKGCINVENKYYFNDVSLDDSGNFYATHMFDSNYSMVNLAWNVLQIKYGISCKMDK